MNYRTPSRRAVSRHAQTFAWSLALLASLAPAAWSVTASFTYVATGATDAIPIFSSPVLVDLDGDRRTLEIVIGDDTGAVFGFDSAGNRLWRFSIRQFPGFEWVQTPCDSSPAVADLDRDGKMEVVATLASRDTFEASKPGALFMFRLDATGRNPTHVGGFARLAVDHNKDGFREGFFASPSVADIDGDGDLEVLAAGWDQLVYAIHHTGALAWNLNYDVTDDEEYGFKSGETMWTTPAVADIDLDGVREVVVSSDAHDFPWGHQVPYQMKNGGLLVVLTAPTGMLEWGPPGAGKFFIESYAKEGFSWWYNPNGENHIPVDNIDEVLQSSPVLADIDADGAWEILHGTGQEYYTPSTPNHNRIYAWNGENATSRWTAEIGQEVYSYCAAVNVDNEPDLEVFARTFHWTAPRAVALKGSTGAMLPGFPVPIQAGNPVSNGVVVGDVDGDGEMEMLTVAYGHLHVINPFGVQEWDIEVPNLLYTVPAIGDIDGDGRCELVIAMRQGIQIYRCNGTAGVIPWPQFLRDARHSGVVPLFDSKAASAQVLGVPEGGGTVPVRVRFHNIGSFVWSPASVSISCLTPGWTPGAITLPPSAYVLNGRELVLDFVMTAPRQLGAFTLQLQMRDFSGAPFGEVATIPVTIGAMAGTLQSHSFGTNSEGWQWLAAPPALVEPAHGWAPGALTMTEAAGQSQIVWGSWESPQVPGVAVSPGFGRVLRARVRMRSSVNGAACPGFRLRAITTHVTFSGGRWLPDYRHPDFNSYITVNYRTTDPFFVAGREPGSGKTYTLLSYPEQTASLADPMVVTYFGVDLLDADASFTNDAGTLYIDSLEVDSFSAPAIGAGQAEPGLSATNFSAWSPNIGPVPGGASNTAGLVASGNAGGLTITVAPGNQWFLAQLTGAGATLTPARYYRMSYSVTSNETPGGDFGPTVRAGIASAKFVYSADKELFGGSAGAHFTATPRPFEVWLAAPTADPATPGRTETMQPRFGSWLTNSNTGWPFYKRVSGTVRCTQLATESFVAP